MLRMPSFDVVTPQTVDEAVRALQTPGSRVVAGGTDLLPNLKHRLDTPERLVSLAAVAELRDTVWRAEHVIIGAGVTLAEIAENREILADFPSLAKAAGVVASPAIRNTATIGGNIHLDTRCRYVNQTKFWRSAIGGCLKSEGDVCHVVTGGKNCVAAMSSDCVPVLTVLDAVVVLAGADGVRRVAIADYYSTNGISHIQKAPDEIMTAVEIPRPTGPRRCDYVKWTVRNSIDFPLISVALRFDLASETNDIIERADICAGVLNAKPRRIKRTDSLRGMHLGDPATAAAAATLIAAQAKPLGNVPYDADYRRTVLPVHVRRAVEALGV